MEKFNRLVILAVLLIGLAVCGIVIQMQGEKIDNLSSDIVALEAEVDDLREDYEAIQTITANRLDEMTEQVDNHDTLITELERLFYSQ